MRGNEQVGALALNDDEGDAVDEANQIGAAGLAAAAPFDLEFLGDVEDVALRVLPIDVVQREALGVAVHSLRQADAQRQPLVDALIGDDGAVVWLVEQRVHRFADVRAGKGDALPPELDRVMLPQPRFQHGGEHDAPAFALAQGQCLGRREILPAHRHQQPGGGDLRTQVFVPGREGIGVHCKFSLYRLPATG